MVNPLTTLVEAVRAQGGQTISQAVATVQKSLGLSEGFDLINTDPIAAALDPNADGATVQVALQVQAAAAKVANVLVQGAATVAAATTAEESEQDSAAAVITSLAETLLAGGGTTTVDLGDETVLKNLVTKAVTTADATAQVANDVADAIGASLKNANASIDQAVVTGGDATTVLNAQTLAQRTAQEEGRDQVTQAVKAGDAATITLDDTAVFETINTANATEAKTITGTGPQIPPPPPPPPVTFSVTESGGTLTLEGVSTDAVVVDLSGDSVTRAGSSVAVTGSPNLTDVAASGFKGNVTVQGTVAELNAATLGGVDVVKVKDSAANLSAANFSTGKIATATEITVSDNAAATLGADEASGKTLTSGVSGARVNVTGAAGAQTVSGSAGNDTIDGGADNDSLTGGAGNDSLSGGAGVDTIDGGAGADTIVASAGNDQVSGGNDNDSFQFTAALIEANSGTTATFNGGTGTDTVVLSDASTGLVDADLRGFSSVESLTLSGASTIDLGANANSAGITTVTTGAGATQITTANTLSVTATALAANTDLTLAGAGNVTVTALQGNIAGAGSGTLNVGLAADVADDGVSLVAGSGNMTVTGGAATDTVTVTGLATASQSFTAASSGAKFNITGGANAQAITGSNQADTIDGGAGNDTVSGGLGNDSLTAGAGNDSLDGGGGTDTFVFAANLTVADTVAGGTGADTLTYTDAGATNELDNVTAVETVTLGDAISSVVTVDGLVAAAATLTVDGSGLTGTNTLTFDGSAETDGAFNVTGGAAGDTVAGGAGNDTITGGAGKDTVTVGGGNDTVIFAAGTTDTVATASSIAGVDLFNDLTLNAALADQIDLTIVVATVGTAVSGSITEASFVTDMNTLLNVGAGAGFDTATAADISAAVVTANAGDLTTRSFLAVDLDASDTFTAADFVIEITGSTVTSLTTATFI